jgi:uncharacterized membrane protein YgdD (TMEM256/DUF423 family)
MLTGKKIAVIGALLSGLAIALGAFGAHALKGLLSPERLETYHTAVSYFQWHSLVLMIVGLLFLKTKQPSFRLASITLVLGMVFFSGSLFALIATDISLFGAITPVGGALFIGSWLLIARGLHVGLIES